MNRQPKRKSLLSQQAALAGLSFSGRDSKPPRPDPPRLNLVPENATPICRPLTAPSSRGSTAGRSRIPSSIRPPNTFSSVGPKQTRGGMGARSNSVMNLQRGVGRAQSKPIVRSTMRRSVSMESFGPMSANKSAFATPLYSRGISPGSKLSSAARPTGTKLAKLPSDVDKSTLTSIIELIITHLQELHYGKELTPAVFRSLTAKDLQNILVFLISYLLGPNEGKNKKDENTFIFDGLSQLNSPAILSKSAIKTLNTKHNLAQVYTVMAWLCCTIATFENSDLESATVNRNLHFETDQEFQEVFDEISWQFYVRLFNQADCGYTTNMEAEFKNFRSKLDDACNLESQPPSSELEEQIQEKKRCLDAMIALVDPRADVMHTLKDQEEMSKNSMKRIADLQEQLQKLTDLTAIETEITVVKSELARKKKNLLRMKKSMEQQQITKEKANLMIVETANIRKKQELLKSITAELEQKFKREEKFLQNNMERFYDVCSKFAIVESYNNAAKMWDGKFAHVDANVFDVDTMENWIAETKAKLGSAVGYLKQETKRYSDNLRSTERTLADLDDQLDTLQEELDRKSNELSFQMHEQVSKSDQIQAEIQAAQNKLQAAENATRILLEEQNVLKTDIQSLAGKHSEWGAYLDDLKSYSTELEEKVEHQYDAHLAAEVEVKCDIQAFVIEARAQVYAPLTELDDPNYQP